MSGSKKPVPSSKNKTVTPTTDEKTVKGKAPKETKPAVRVNKKLLDEVDGYKETLQRDTPGKVNRETAVAYFIVLGIAAYEKTRAATTPEGETESKDPAPAESRSKPRMPDKF